jgi:YD repeat-containing protein
MKAILTAQVDAPDSKQSRTYYDTGSRSLPASDITSGTLVPQSGRVTSRRDYLVADTTYVSVAFDYDNNSQVTVTTDQNTNEWTKTYDAMGRHRTTVTPTVSSTSECPRLRIGAPQWCDGNGNAAKDQAQEWACYMFSYDTEYVMVPEAFQVRISQAGGLCYLLNQRSRIRGNARAAAARMSTSISHISPVLPADFV